MFVKVERDYETMSQRGARIVADLVKQKSDAVLGLATGSTPVGLYENLIRIAKDENIDFSGITTFNLDEYEGLPASHPESYHTFMQVNLFDGLGLSEQQTNLLSGMDIDPVAQCADFEMMIRRAGGIDLQILGIGGDGHIAFCEPGSSLAGRTSLVALHPKTIADNARFFDKKEDVPRKALTMGVGTILEARSCLILAAGDAKSEVWAQMIEGPVTSQVTASALQFHPWTIAISDRDAAAKLKNLDFYQHIDGELADQPELPLWVFQPELDQRRNSMPTA
ncbi:MAG: glucosamine-6-phosphate deaminase [Pirellulaceae bacterium]